ncbi:hypothetical protein MJ585_25150 [Klebsiella pneumoniae]|nr:hypothetical protein MJ585_25150 [Klebsiella pneumoniae]
MQHRGAILADGKTGDGCGLLLQKPDRFFRIVAEERGWRLAKSYAVGMLFLNKILSWLKRRAASFEEELQLETLSIVGWRDVPTNLKGVLGEIALSSLPRIEQIFVNAPALAPARYGAPSVLLRVVTVKNACGKTRISTFVACPIWSTSIKVCMRQVAALPGPRGPAPGVVSACSTSFSTNTVPRWPLKRSRSRYGAQR